MYRKGPLQMEKAGPKFQYWPMGTDLDGGTFKVKLAVTKGARLCTGPVAKINAGWDILTDTNRLGWPLKEPLKEGRKEAVVNHFTLKKSDYSHWIEFCTKLTEKMVLAATAVSSPTTTL